MATTKDIERAPERFNFAQYITGLNVGRADKTAYIDDYGALSYGELAHRTERFAAQLLQLGIRREERVLLAMHDNRDWPVCFLGCLHAGVVPVAVNTLLHAEDYAWMLRDSHARAVLTSAPLHETMCQAMGAAGAPEIPVIVSAPGDDRPPEGALHMERLMRSRATAPVADTGRDDIAFWLYSSGSTGRPKGTVHTHGNLFATNESYGRHVLDLGADDITFSAAKLFFAYGLGNALTFPLCAGATVVLMAERPTPQAVFRRLIEQQASAFFGVPTLYANMMAAQDLPPREAVQLRCCISAGEALPADLGERFSGHFGVPVLDGIGSTEMLHIFLSNRRDALRYGTSGKPVPGYELRLLDEDDQPVADDTIGDLYVRGDSQALMYWCNRDKSRSTFLGEWMRTGDKYLRDAQGWYTYAGRADDMLKVSGQYVSPFEVESALVQHPAVLEAAYIGVTDNEGLTRGKAFVVLNAQAPAGGALVDELRAMLKQRLTPHKVPRNIKFIEELPKTPTGKIQRFRLRALEADRPQESTQRDVA